METGAIQQKSRPTYQVVKNTQLVNLLIVDFTGSVLFSEEASSHPARLRRKLPRMQTIRCLVYVM